MFLLDTNVISELRKASKADSHVVAWAKAVPASSMYISSVTVLEIEMGVLRIQRKDPVQGERLRVWFDDEVIPAFSRRILDFDTDIALACARLHVPNPRSERDALISATALVHGFTVVTRNIQDFKNTGVRLLNPWDKR